MANYAERSQRVVARLASIGVGHCDTVALITNRPEFNLADCSVLHLGAIPWSIYNRSAPEQIVHMVANAGSLGRSSRSP